ncbi:hypothetical protein C8F04DRAFT_1000632 [Mycena alexandri]|uniref:ubiquitinyl hydrolase 1 n=1 Tax=Mycena alexandri TaxID=1745969 RepID=A0AAD6SWY6_9AGAR|nr:hypothetical protein C8F04DRAFT_1000632 [Mycena alexandri]
MPASLDYASLDYAINHLFLPPKLPQQDDSTNADSQRALLQHISACAESFCEGLQEDGIDSRVRACWRRLRDTLLCFAHLHDVPSIDKNDLEAVVNAMGVSGEYIPLPSSSIRDVLCFHITSQNAGVVLRRKPDEILVEFFQASPKATAVTETKGKLVIQYPSRPRLSIPCTAACVHSLSALLASLDSTPMPDTIPKTVKAGGAQAEHRDVRDIRYVSELFGGIARSLTPVERAESIAASTIFVTKRISDHVLWKDTLLPWRRWPKWLIIRVALQTTLAEWKVPDQYGYKVFIAFVLTKTLESAIAFNGVSTELLFIMNAKIATRMWKLRSFFDSTSPKPTNAPFPLQFILNVTNSVESRLRLRWKEVRKLEAQESTWTFTQFEAARRFTLPQSSSHFEAVKTRNSVLSNETTAFHPLLFEENLRTNGSKLEDYTPGVSSAELWLTLFNIENRLSTPSPVAFLSDLDRWLTYYNEMALSFKSRNPEVFSRIFLIVLELWVELDRNATRQFPLLLDYSPELVADDLEPLLLPELSQMRRLRNIENYLANRHARVRYPHLSVFKLSTDPNSLPFRHFTLDLGMQNGRDGIVLDATMRRNRKAEELRSMTDIHNTILEEMQRLEHLYTEFTDRWGNITRSHASNCDLCAKERKVRNLTILGFEWPLPEEDALNRLVAFELQVPQAFGIWRDATYRLARQYSNLEPERSSPEVVLRKYTGLKVHFAPHSRTARITIASTTKSFAQSHYNAHHFPCSEAEIIQNHPLRYQLWDDVAREWLPSVFPVVDIRAACTPTFPSGPYRSLTWAAVGTVHAPNDVIARQSQCPVELSYHEWENVGHLRAGVRLQWRNIILQLISGAIDLANPSVHLMFQQAAWQAETASADNGPYREAHFDLSQEDFGAQMLHVLDERLKSISGNWKEGWTAATLVVVACRLFSLTESKSVKQQVLTFLSSLRHVLFTWVRQVSALLNKPSELGSLSTPRADLVNRVLQLAASCRQTYTVGPESLQNIFRDHLAVSVFIQCAITLHTNIPQTINNVPSSLRYLLERDVVVAVEALPLLRNTIPGNADGLDDAILATWQGFRRDSAAWRVVGERWIACMTSDSSDRQVRSVYFNLLDGSLLVDGHAQGILPMEILEHSLFKTIFPNWSTLDIIPSTMKGMSYQSRDNIDGYEIHFQLDEDLIIRIRDGFNLVSEFIPPKYLQGDLPNDLITGMVHIFCERNENMYIHPAPSGWLPRAPVAWTLDLASRLVFSRSENMLDPRSSVVQQLARIFRPLEALETNLAVSIGVEKLHIKLPRYNLEFSVDPVAGHRLESKELPGFYVSGIQSIGTLIGLQNKLVLKSMNGEMAKVFIPEGQITISGGDSDHPTVTISPSPNVQHVKTFSYDIDDIVGRIVGDGSLTSWYRLAYLHIATTSHFPDPLLRRTGLQEGQEMLHSTQAFAFMALEAEHNEILQQILNLTPTREYYPAHLKSMETIEWHEFLPILVQCGRFVPLVNAIVDYARKQAMFHSSAPTCITAAYRGKIGLWDRADVRVSRLVSAAQIDACDTLLTPTRCGIAMAQNEMEALATARDAWNSTEKEQAVAQVAFMVGEWPKTVIEDNLWKHFTSWGKFTSEPVADDKIDNSRAWLQDPPSQVWFRLFHFCNSSLRRDTDQYGLMVAFAILAYRDDIPFQLIQPLLSIAANRFHSIPATSVDHAAMQIPMDTFDLGIGHTLTRDEVLKTVRGNSYTSHPDPSWLPRQDGESHWGWSQRREVIFSVRRDSQCNMLAGMIFVHWPRLPDVAAILPDSLTDANFTVRIADLRIAVQNLFTAKLRNRTLFESSRNLHRALNNARGFPPNNPIQSRSPMSLSITTPPPKFKPVTLRTLLSERGAPPFPKRSTTPVSAVPAGASKPPSSVRQLIGHLEKMAIDGPKSQYITDLSRCLDAFGRKNGGPSNLSRGDYQYDPEFDKAIRRALRPQTMFEQCLQHTGQWPSTAQQSFLQYLSRERWEGLPESWKVILRRYAEGLAARQQRRRTAVLDRFGLAGEGAGTRGGQGWDSSVYPDWLLVQLDADLFIRPLQAGIADKMMFPQSHNALMQLNMGEGKSSVIVPIISTALADGEQFVRVVVLKPLADQMFQLLKQRVCGLANRRLFYLPFSRDIPLDCSKIQTIFALFKECAESGVILPEHILSFQLMGLHAFTQSKNSNETRMLREVQNWLDVTARDILDESDEILNTRYQLIYTVGSSSPPDGRPWRWKITQTVFSLLQTVVKTIPEGLEVGAVVEPCQFPATRILTAEGGQFLLDSLIHVIVVEDGFQEWISFRNYSERLKILVFRFLRQPSISPQAERALREVSGDRFGYLLLLRGLLAHGVLILALREKRWRVDYGLDARRSMLAVPYRAKDSSAPRAEFGHPDMIIVLTCLSYYYSGLTDDQLDVTFRLLLHSDNPEAQYEEWVKGITALPASLANSHGLNLDDFEQKTQTIFPLLRFNKAVIDFYLAECVFPQEAREFQHKLTTNAWDLARKTKKSTTGFSGTNDNKYLLPLSIEQRDQPSQLHTNAQVLDYILRKENRAVIYTDCDDASGLLRRVAQQEPPVMVLLDVGAQVLELQNVDVAREWLNLDNRRDVEAAVYFDPSTDEIRVISRNGRIQPFASSLYKKQLEKTLVYLDEAHTRGTDFKFPPGSRAVVTLGPRLTKDKLVQGCMRMRRLGKDHSVLFFASAEIQTKITAKTGVRGKIDSMHVLLWTIQETCVQIRDNGALWANQGLNFDARTAALEEYRAGGSYDTTVAALQERESRTLEELYGVASRSQSEPTGMPLTQLQSAIMDKCQLLGIAPSDTALSEEQERELAHEKESEQEVERVPGAKALVHRNRDEGLRHFIRTGAISPSNSFISLEDCLARTSWISLLPPGKIFRGSKLFATEDFRDTIALSKKGLMDRYIRTVQWVVSSSKSDILILVSPFEANQCLPEIRRSKITYLHLYAPRVSRNASRPMDMLDSFTVPQERRVPISRQLIQELNLFAGQLFCANKPSMEEVCGILGLHFQSVSPELHGVIDSTGFVKNERARKALAIETCTFTSNPLPFFRELFGARRKGQGFALTHMGQMLRGNEPKDPSFEEVAVARGSCQEDSNVDMG